MQPGCAVAEPSEKIGHRFHEDHVRDALRAETFIKMGGEVGLINRPDQFFRAPSRAISATCIMSVCRFSCDAVLVDKRFESRNPSMNRSRKKMISYMKNAGASGEKGNRTRW